MTENISSLTIRINDVQFTDLDPEAFRTLLAVASRGAERAHVNGELSPEQSAEIFDLIERIHSAFNNRVGPVRGTLAKRYNREVLRLMPHMGRYLRVDPTINNESEIYDTVFSRSEYLGGMAAVILALIRRPSLVYDTKRERNEI